MTADESRAEEQRQLQMVGWTFMAFFGGLALMLAYTIVNQVGGTRSVEIVRGQVVSYSVTDSGKYPKVHLNITLVDGRTVRESVKPHECVKPILNTVQDFGRVTWRGYLTSNTPSISYSGLNVFCQRGLIL